ncbi:MAG: hypothetical protein JNM49_02735 [Flavobacteriales bacterium]|nr:hypothetical protein [Flavobacteriales bacterium]
MNNITRSVWTIALTLAFASTSLAQHHSHGSTQWKEQSAFHTVMSQTFHPAEEGDLHPIRERSVDMVAKAKSWQASAIPAEYKDVKGIQENLAALVDGSTKLDAKIKAGAKDEEILKDLSALHDVFHKIVGLCRPAGSGHHH